MVDIIHRVGIQAPIGSVYAALATAEGVAGWWTEETTGDSKPGGTIKFRFASPTGKELGKMEVDVLALAANQKVHWRFTQGPQEWLGTDVVFNLSQDGEYTIVHFAHQNWREANEFMGHCSTKWATFLVSLKKLVETGEGNPSPRDLKIDNWN